MQKFPPLFQERNEEQYFAVIPVLTAVADSWCTFGLTWSIGKSGLGRGGWESGSRAECEASADLGDPVSRHFMASYTCFSGDAPKA